MATNEQKKANDTAATKAKQEKAGASVQKEQISQKKLTKKDVENAYDEMASSSFIFESNDYSKRAQMDRRASLTVMPKIGTSASTLFSDKVLYALGTEQVTLPFSKDRKFDNFLQAQLGKVGGLIFPYTPKISMSYAVNYETTDIPQSNVQYNSYKNSPPPSIDVTAHFTADEKSQAKHMLSAIWFLQALSKCDVGDGKTYYVGKDKTVGGGGLPPPILYFNAYEQMIENIPVVLKSFSFSYQDDIDYVNLIINMENYSRFNVIDDMYFTTNLKNQTSMKTTINELSLYKASLDDPLKMSFWLPMKMDISMSFLIQPNLAREDNVFNLDAYKVGILKNPNISATLTSNGKIVGSVDTFGKKTNKDMSVKWTEGNKKYLPTGWSW